jgi:hypothetical protein
MTLGFVVWVAFAGTTGTLPPLLRSFGCAQFELSSQNYQCCEFLSRYGTGVALSRSALRKSGFEG